MNQPIWRFQLLGQFRACGAGRVIERFRTQKTASLLAFLVCNPNRLHSREWLVELLWPDSPFEAARTNLRVAINSLRKQLEPPGSMSGSVLLSTRDSIGINGKMVSTDLSDFEDGIRLSSAARDDRMKAELLAQAISLYGSRFLPGLYDDWIVSEQERLATIHLQALRKLSALCSTLNEMDSAVEYAYRAASEDPLSEEDQEHLIRLLIESGQPSAAVRHFRHYESLLKEQYNASPCNELRLVIEPYLNLPVVESAAQAPPALPLPPAQMNGPATASEIPQSASLPPLVNATYGRAELSASVSDLLLTPGTFITLAGPGGIGKTRLSLEIAHSMRSRFPGPVAFVSLVDLVTPDSILSAVVRSFGIAGDKQKEPVRSLAERFGSSPVLVILDNFEHLMSAGTEEVTALRLHLPTASILITSRHTLGLQGERLFTVPPLSVPDLPAEIGLWGRSVVQYDVSDDLMSNDAVRLFIDRAQAIKADFQITPRNALDLAQICERLEGVPLAIELAASWINTLTPRQMLERLRSTGTMLESRSRDLSHRHRTLRGAVAWSYHLLSPELQSLFRMVCIFHGGWTLEAFAAVRQELAASGTGAKDSHHSTLEASALLAELQDRSLVFGGEEIAGSESRMRFRMLETLREFGESCIDAEEMKKLSAAHAAWALKFAESKRQQYNTDLQEQAITELYADHRNMHCAIKWLLENDGAAAINLCVYLHGMWSMRRMERDALPYLRRALSLPQNQGRTADRASALNVSSMLESNIQNVAQAERDLTEALEIRRAVQDPGPLGSTLSLLGNHYFVHGKYEDARKCYLEAVDRLREAGKLSLVAVGLRNISLVELELGDMERATGYIKESLALCNEIQYGFGVIQAIGTLGVISHLQRDYAGALDCYLQCLAHSREHSTTHRLPADLNNLGALYTEMGEVVKSAECFIESLTITLETGDRTEIHKSLDHVGKIVSVFDAGAAARLFGAATALRAAIQEELPPVTEQEYLDFLAELQSRIGAERYASERGIGERMDLVAAVTFAIDRLNCVMERSAQTN